MDIRSSTCPEVGWWDVDGESYGDGWWMVGDERIQYDLRQNPTTIGLDWIGMSISISYLVVVKLDGRKHNLELFVAGFSQRADDSGFRGDFFR